METNHYRTIEWLAKRKAIIERDNCTCQNCGTFDPSSGIVTVFNKKENDIELHEYNSGSSDYILTSHKHGITLNIEFGWGTWLVTPILQVHHKKYITDYKIHEYPDSDLVTLCKACHTDFHKENKINIYDHNNNIIDSRLMDPKDQDYRKSHSFKPWTFVNKIGNEYSIASVQPQLTFFVMENELERADELKITAYEMFEYFFERFLPNYKPKLD